MKRIFAAVLAVSLLLSLAACGLPERINDTPPDIYPGFEGQTAPVELSVPASGFTSVQDGWRFWSVTDPYLPETMFRTASSGTSADVAEIQTGFQYDITTISKSLREDKVCSELYDFAETLTETHDSGVVDGYGCFTAYRVTAGFGGVLKSRHGAFDSSYDDMQVWLVQDCSQFVSPNEIGVSFKLDGLTAENQDTAYHIVSAVFGSDLAQLLVCGEDKDGLDKNGGALANGQLDDLVTSGDCKYRFTRTVEALEDGYLVRMTGVMDELPVSNSFWYHNVGYVPRYASTPLSLSSLLGQPGMSEYQAGDADLSFEQYFEQFSNPLTGYWMTLPQSFVYSEMHGSKDENLYSLQSELYGVGAEVSDEPGQFRGLQVSYVVKEQAGSASAELYLSGQTTATLFEGELSEADVDSLSSQVTDICRYFFPEAELSRGEDEGDIRVYTADVVLLDKQYELTCRMTPVQTDGMLWVEWELTI